MIYEKTRRGFQYAQLNKTAQARNQVDKKIRRLHISILNFMFNLLFLQARCREHQTLWLCVLSFHRSVKTVSPPRNDMCLRCFTWVVSSRSLTCWSSVTNKIFFLYTCKYVKKYCFRTDLSPPSCVRQPRLFLWDVSRSVQGIRYPCHRNFSIFQRSIQQSNLMAWI